MNFDPFSPFAVCSNRLQTIIEAINLFKNIGGFSFLLNWIGEDLFFIKTLFLSLWETTQTLFWAAFGLIDLDNFELSGIKEFTRFWGLIMFGSFSLINIIVLLNLLIAMMNHSYQLISVSSVSVALY